MSMTSYVLAGPALPEVDSRNPLDHAKRLLAEATHAMDSDRSRAREVLSEVSAHLATLRPASCLKTCQEPEGVLAPWQARKATTYVGERLDARIRVSELASTVRLSSSYFSRAFKSTFGVTPREFVANRRIERAKNLMTTTDVTLCDVALQCGFADQAHFSRVFRRMTGSAPSAWRRNSQPEPMAAR